MKKIKMLKTFLIPTIGITAIGTIAAVSTSCSSAGVSVTSVSLNKNSIILDKGGSETLTATVLPENATDKSVTWSSSDPTVAAVDRNGNVYAGWSGSAKITVTTDDGGFTDTCQVTVQEMHHVTNVELNKSSTTLSIGETETLTATVHPEDATDKSVTWTSSNSSVATVDNNGKVTAVSEGQAIITVKTNDGGFTATCQVTVHQETIHVIDVWMNKNSLVLYTGYSDTLIATVFPETATDKSVTWSSSDSSVATVDNNGKVTAISEGPAKITVTTNDGGYEDYCDVTVVDTSDVMHVTANADSTLELINDGGNNPNLQYSVDLKIWHDYSGVIRIPTDTNLYLKGNNQNGWSQSEQAYSHFNTTGNVSISGSIMSLLDNGTGTISSIPNDYCFNALFHHSTGITSVSKNFLPATELTEYCYVNMFLGCSSLTTVPDLPATTLAEACYSGMFNDCSSLTTAPGLPATTVAVNCYSSMFGGCTSLKIVPNTLPATTLAEACYTNMFSNCTSLTTTPTLPATTLAPNCYGGMFFTCTSLTESPVLPATTLANACYKYIFAGCVNLTSIEIGYTGTVAGAPAEAFSGWVNLVPAIHGTFWYQGTDTLENFGLPSSWHINPN